MKNPLKSFVSSPYRDQVNAFERVPQRSLRMTLCLNGTVPVRELALADVGNVWLSNYLDDSYPEAMPGAFGPITIVLVL